MRDENMPFLSGELVYLRAPIVDTDVLLGDWHHWFNDIEVTKYLVHGVYPISREQQADFVKQNLANPSTMLLAIVSKANDKHIGVISLKNIDLVNRNAEIAIVMGSTSIPGAALEAMGLLIDHSFCRLNLRKVYAGQNEDLWKWINQLELIGFQLEGYRAEMGSRNGKSYGIVFTSVVAERYFHLKSKRGGNIMGESLIDLLRERRRENLVLRLMESIVSFQKLYNEK